MKVLLCSVSFATPYTPQLHFLSLGYLHAMGQEDPITGPATEIVHEFYDSSTMPVEDIAAAMAAHEPDVVAFSCYVWNTPDVLRVSEAYYKLRPETVVLVGGPEVSYHYTRVLQENPHIDYVGVGEGEFTFRDFLRALVQKDEAALHATPGLAYRKDGKAHLPAAREYQKDLDVFPSPYLTGVLDVCEVRGGVNYQSARGCPFACTYCDYGRNQPFFEFSMERVRAEFELFEKGGARILFNTDPTFNFHRERAAAILELGIELGIEATHWFEVFPSLINEELVDLVGRSHLSFIGCGIQSSNRQTMKNIRRVWNPDKVQPLVDRLARMDNVILSPELIMGLPGDNLQNFKDTLSWTYARQPDDIKSFNLAILPRTPLEQEVEKWSIEFDPTIGHEIIQTQDMDNTQVQVGKAINEWHRVLQSVFLRLCPLFDMPAADILERWAWRVYHAGHHQFLGDLQAHRIPSQLIESLSVMFEEFVAELCSERGVADVSGPFREYTRYLLYRRATTWAAAFFMDVRDVYFHEPRPEVHRYLEATEATLLEAHGDDLDLDMVPEFGSNVSIQSFDYDMRELYPRTSAADIAGTEQKHRDYLFFMTPEQGGGCAIEMDEHSLAFVRLVDGKRNLGQITAAMPAASRRLAPQIFQTLSAHGLFTRPRILPEDAGATIEWHSSFPEEHRAYH